MRPFKCRTVEGEPVVTCFKPNGIPAKLLEEIILTVDELEAVRLDDFEGLYQEEAAKKMGISRQTFGNIITSAHKKIADCIVNGKALKIKGGTISMKRRFLCSGCKNEWEEPFGTGRPEECPKCGSKKFQRANKGSGGCGCRGRRSGCSK